MRYIIIEQNQRDNYALLDPLKYYQLRPVKLHKREAYVLPEAVMQIERLPSEIKRTLDNLPKEKLTRKDFEWFHSEEEIL